LRGGPVFALLATISIFLAVGYTGGPLPLAYLGIGEFFVLLFYGIIATSGTAYLQTHTFSWDPVFLGLIPGLAATAVLAVANMRDIEEDRKVGKKTLAARFGHRFAKLEYTSCLLAAIFLPLIFGFYLPL